MGSFRAQLTALYLAFFSVLFLLFSIFLYGELSRSLVARLDATLASEADTAAVLFPDELQEMKGDPVAAAHEVVNEMKVHGDFLAIREGDRVLAASPQAAPGPRDRSVTRTVEAGGRTYQIVAAASLDPIQAELAVVRRVIFIALPLILAIAGLGGYWLATRGLRRWAGWRNRRAALPAAIWRHGVRNRQAAEELAVLVTSFNELLSRLDQSFESMRRFVQDASHELRTPLAVIHGEADVALSHDRGAAEYKESLATIQEESRRLARLVDDLLNLASADAGHVQLRVEELYLNDLLAECCRSVRPMAAARNIEAGVSLESATWPCADDEELLRRMILNLLDNAIRYTPPGGRVSAGVETQGSEVRIQVADTGIGIPPEASPHVFERFYRADKARSRQEGGFGLGLSIVKWIAESHHGTVECNSAAGHGSVFTVTLPK